LLELHITVLFVAFDGKIVAVRFTLPFTLSCGMVAGNNEMPVTGTVTQTANNVVSRFTTNRLFVPPLGNSGVVAFWVLSQPKNVAPSLRIGLASMTV
jgi:hypothetical protein